MNAEPDHSLFETVVEQSARAISREAVQKTRVLDEDESSRRGSSGSSPRDALLARLTVIASEAGFDVEGLLGRGGMGAVLLGRDRELGRRVALKFMLSPDSANAQALHMFRREAERSSRLTHENVVQVYSWHSVGQLTFFVMEYVEGENLQEYVVREFRLSVSEVLRIMAEAAAGVASAHDAGILHRDIKPQNILIGKSGRVKVADFGLSSTTEEGDGKDPLLAGTIGFMAPEQARGEKATPASDVYSLAATLYYAVARSAPYGSAHNTKLLLSRNRAGNYIPLQKAKAGLPDAIYTLVDQGMAPNPAHRPKDAAAFRRLIEEALLHLHDGPAKGPALLTRLPDWMSPVPFGAGLGIGVVLGAGGCALAMWLLGMI